MAKLKQNYLVLKVVKIDEKNDLYDNIYKVTDESGELNLLGYYDEKQTQPIYILTNKAVLEYDWSGIASRVMKQNKEYCDQFLNKERIIIITPEAKTEDPSKNYVINGNVMFITEYRYNTEFKQENVIQEKKDVPENKVGIFDGIKKALGLNTNVVKPKKSQEEQYQTFIGDLTESEKFAAKHVKWGIAFMLLLSALFIYVQHRYDNSYKPTEVTEEFMQKITQSTNKVVFDSVKIDTIAIPEQLALNENLNVTAEQQRFIDSLAKEKRYQDSVTLYLKLNRKVKVSLYSAINDGHTERTAKTEMVADSLRSQDIAQLTTVINKMTKEMNNERLEELKQQRFISPGTEGNFILGMSKNEQ